MIMQQIRPVPPQRPLRRGGRRGAAAARGGGAAGGREPAGQLRAAPRRPPAAGDARARARDAAVGAVTDRGSCRPRLVGYGLPGTVRGWSRESLGPGALTYACISEHSLMRA